MQKFIKDYDFIGDISPLFENIVIIYGAGYQGEKTAELLDDICVGFECFCDKDENKKIYMDHPVITIDELKRKTDHEKCFIIIASINYCEEIAEELQNNKVNAYVCSWFGFKKGIEINIEEERLPETYRKEFSSRKDAWLKCAQYDEYQGRVWQNQMYIYSHPYAIFIYQCGKVGSATLLTTMIKEKIDVLHIHWMLTGYEDIEIPDTGWMHLISEMRKRKKPLKMIVCVREPLGRALSDFMQQFQPDFLHFYNNSLGIKENANIYMKKLLDGDYEFTWWFDDNLKALTGIDVYEYPFDKERGYAWIKEDGIEILLLKMEKMNENQEVIGAFVGRPELKLVPANIGSKNAYRYIYDRLKEEIVFPARLVKEQYENERYKHFYTEEETLRFKKKWGASDEGLKNTGDSIVNATL